MPPGSSDDGRSRGIDSDARSVNTAWERHHLGALDAEDPALGVRSAIHKSWERSSSAGIDPQAGEAPSAEGAADVERLRNANRELCRAARGSLDKIGRMLLGTEAMLILTDERGLVIEAIGDPETLEAGRKINLHVGGLWNEHAVGTNGIGTALWAGEPMFVHGSEHYVESLKEWSCAAAPIRNPIDQSVIGAVDLSGLTKIFRHHNTAFAAAAAGEIQAALAQALNEERIRLLDALIEQVPFAGHEDGVVILDRAGRILHRSGFERLILDDGTELDTRLGHRFVELAGEPSADTVAASLPAALGCRGISDLHIDGELRGIALVLESKRRAAKPTAPRLARTPVPARRRNGGPEIVAESPGMLEAMDLARRVSHVNAPVLVQGETGTGKELFARLIHAEHSGPRQTPFVAINCGAISRELFGGELFGHVDGAFTGAMKQGKAGKLEEAEGGVFCLD
ncbi:MAG: sigma 54-interacting transcriptional regulator, partial [Pseudomonadota bacterium]